MLHVVGFAFWAKLMPSCGHSGRTLGILGVPWGNLGYCQGHLGVILGGLGGYLGPHGGLGFRVRTRVC